LANLMKGSLESRRPEGFLGGVKDFMFDRIDDTIEPLARDIGVKTLCPNPGRTAAGPRLRRGERCHGSNRATGERTNENRLQEGGMAKVIGVRLGGLEHQNRTIPSQPPKRAWHPNLGAF